jgi:hypothetical protein
MFDPTHWNAPGISKMMSVAGKWEKEWTISTLFSSAVTAYDGDSKKYSLYLTHVS